MGFKNGLKNGVKNGVQKWGLTMGSNMGFRNGVTKWGHCVALDSFPLGFIQIHFIKTDTLPPFGQK